jgi:hypothetical protein
MSILAVASNTLVGTPVAGQIEYDGQFFGTDSNASRAQLQRIVRATAVASTSGTSIDFTGNPAWVERITVMFNEVSGSGTSNLLMQLGTGSTTYTTTGYLSSASAISSAVSTVSATTGFVLLTDIATFVNSGHYVLTNISGNIWIGSGMVKDQTTHMTLGAGSVTLGATLTAVRITRVNGTDTFDAGTVNILYEG